MSKPKNPFVSETFEFGPTKEQFERDPEPGKRLRQFIENGIYIEISQYYSVDPNKTLNDYPSVLIKCQPL